MDNMSREEAITLSIKTLLEVVEAGSKNIELAIVQANGELSVGSASDTISDNVSDSESDSVDFGR